MGVKVCDLCGEEGPSWSWLTPNGSGEGWFFEDEVWYVCSTCHELILTGKQDVLTQRALMRIPVLPEASFADPFLREALERGQRDEVTRMHKAFWDRKTTYEELKP